jgi:hypothetical protein
MADYTGSQSSLPNSANPAAIAAGATASVKQPSTDQPGLWQRFSTFLWSKPQPSQPNAPVIRHAPSRLAIARELQNQYLTEDQIAEGKQFAETPEALQQLLLSAAPVFGQIDSANTALTGQKFVSGQPAAIWDRVVSGGGVTLAAFPFFGTVRNLTPVQKTGALSGQTLGQAKTTLRTAAEAHKGSTRLGHALSKHAGRKSDVWGNISGSPSTYHSQAMKHLREIYRAPGSFQKVTYPSGVSFLEKMLPDGRGLRLQLDHVFKGFID